MKRRLVLFAVIILTVSAITAISFAQRRPDNADKPIAGDFKITIRTTMAGQTGQSTTMIKGQRERDESNMSMGGMNMPQVNITSPTNLQTFLEVANVTLTATATDQCAP